MYAVLKSHITLGDFEFTQVNSVVITRSIDELSDTATIKMPTSFFLGNKDEGFERKELNKSIKTGDEVTIILGYEGIYEGVEYKGFVKSIKPTVPLEIECEDSIYLIRKKNCSKNFQNTTLTEVLEYIVDGTGVELNSNIPQINFDKFLLKNVNGAYALEQLKEEYGLTVFIDDEGKLFAGLRQQLGLGNPVEYHIQKNVVKDNLTFRTADSVKLKIKAIGHNPDSTTIEVEVGDEDGEIRTYHFHNITSESQLKQVAEEKITKLKYTGFEGDLTSFLYPFADRGMPAKITHNKYPTLEGNYLIEKVKTTYLTNGARRSAYLGNKLSA